MCININENIRLKKSRMQKLKNNEQANGQYIIQFKIFVIEMETRYWGCSFDSGLPIDQWHIRNVQSESEAYHKGMHIGDGIVAVNDVLLSAEKQNNIITTLVRGGKCKLTLKRGEYVFQPAGPYFNMQFSLDDIHHLPTLTIFQPMAIAIFRCGKNVENRSWKINYKKTPWIIIHAAKTKVPLHRYTEYNNVLGDYAKDQNLLTYGAILGIARIKGIRPINTIRYPNEWMKGPLCWMIDYIFELTEPIYCGGQRSIWKIPKIIATQIHEQIKSYNHKQGEKLEHTRILSHFHTCLESPTSVRNLPTTPVMHNPSPTSPIHCPSLSPPSTPFTLTPTIGRIS